MFAVRCHHIRFLRVGLVQTGKQVGKKKPKPQGLVKYCLVYGMHPSELGIDDEEKYNRVLAEYNQFVKGYDREIASILPHGRQASISQIKNRTGGRNRTERRGS